MTHEELAKKIVDAAIRPTTAHEWWLQERGNQFYLAKLYYNCLGNKSAASWHCLFAWATPDIWNDPSVYITKEKIV